MADSIYTIVRDQGGNPGLLCPVCGSARWTSNHRIDDFSTQKDCPNCKLMKENGDVEMEVQKDRVYKEAEAEKKKQKDLIDAQDTKKKKDKQTARAIQKASVNVAKEQGLDDELEEIKDETNK